MFEVEAMAKFSNKSLERLGTCERALQLVFYRVILIRDCTIIQGHRDRKTHLIYMQEGRTRVPYEKTRHRLNPSMAVDAAPWFKKAPHIRWDDRNSWYAFGGLVLGVAWSMGLPLRWGGDWDMDWDFTDQTFHDLCHFEMMLMPEERALVK